MHVGSKETKSPSFVSILWFDQMLIKTKLCCVFICTQTSLYHGKNSNSGIDK